jgi:GNAT superfamily N-acetyltransferase
MDLQYEYVVDGFCFSTDKAKIDLAYVHHFLSQQSYWATGVPIEIVKRSIENSLSFGVYFENKQIGFARLITDFATFGYLADVFVDEQFRGKGISKNLMQFIFSLDELKIFRRMILATRDAHSLYTKYGFKPLALPDRFMELHNPDVYKKTNQQR